MAETGGASLRRKLGPVEAVGLSLSVMAPTMGMALNVTLAVGRPASPRRWDSPSARWWSVWSGFPSSSSPAA